MPGGVTTEILRAAEAGSHVAAEGDVVNLLYKGSLPQLENKVFDSGDIDFVLGDGTMVTGFERGVYGMGVGERRLISVPAKLGYGKKGKRPKIPPNTDLLFDATLTYAGCDWKESKSRISMTTSRREAVKRRRKKQRPT